MEKNEREENCQETHQRLVEKLDHFRYGAMNPPHDGEIGTLLDVPQ